MICGVDEMIDKFDVQPIGQCTFQAISLSGNRGVTDASELLAQSIVAVSKQSPGKVVKSIYMAFSRTASSAEPVEIELDSLSSGRKIASMSVRVGQGSRLCASGQVFLDSNEVDFIRRAQQIPPVASPEASHLLKIPFEGREIRVVEPFDFMDASDIGSPELHFWLRYSKAPEETYLNQAMLAHFSNHFSIATALRPESGLCIGQAHDAFSSGVLTLHLIFYDPVRVDEWLLYAHESPHAGRGLSCGRADIFRQSGPIVASFTQENLIRAMPAQSRDIDNSRVL